MTAPANDLIANAILITGASGSTTPVTIDAATATDTEDTSGDFTMFQTIWYKWVAPSSGMAVFDTSGSVASDAYSGDGDPGVGSFGSLDTKLQVWHGTTPGSLTLVSSNDDTEYSPTGFYGFWSRCRLAVTSGDTYYIHIGSYDVGDYSGTAKLNWSMASATPVNDDVADALTITSTYSNRTGTSDFYPLEGATVETGETATSPPHSSTIAQTLWWKWVADTNGFVSFFSQEIDTPYFAPTFLIYRSSDGTADFAKFTEVGYGTGSGAAYVFLGATYYIALGTTGGEVGQLALSWNLGAGTVEVGDCPTWIIQPSMGEENWATGASFDMVYPYTEAGYVMVGIVASNIPPYSPPGWTTLFNEEWTSLPVSTGYNPGTSPFWLDYPHTYLAAFYKIADGTEVEGDVAWIQTGTNVGGHHSLAGGRIFTFACTDENGLVPLPSPPVKYAGMDVADPRLVDITGESPSSTDGEHNTVTFPTATADAVGNHMFVQVAQIRGYDWSQYYAPGDDSFYPTVYSLKLIPTNVFEFPLGQHASLYEGDYAWVFANALDPWDSGRTPVIMDSAYAPGSIDIYKDQTRESWSDGVTIPPGITTYSIINGLAGASFVVQAPASTLPPNDSWGTAYEFPYCPLIVSQCPMLASNGAGGTVGGYQPYRDLWYKFTPASNETMTITLTPHAGWVIALLDADLSVLTYNDTTGTFTYAVTAGDTYYIQVLKKFDTLPSGTLSVKLDCTGGVTPPPPPLTSYAFWGVLAAAP